MKQQKRQQNEKKTKLENKLYMTGEKSYSTM